MASKTLRERAAEVGMKAMGKLFEDPRRAEAIAKAVGGLQRAKQAIDEAQEKALKAAGLVTREDFKDAGKRLSALKRRCRDLAEELDALLAEQKKPGP
jgi:galactokinase